MQIHEAPHGINVVVDTDDGLVIGRFDSTNGFTSLFHDCDVHVLAEGEDAEAYVRQTAKYGIAVKHKDYSLENGRVKRVRLLGDIEQG